MFGQTVIRLHADRQLPLQLFQKLRQKLQSSASSLPRIFPSGSSL